MSVPFVPTDPAGWPRKPFSSALSAENSPHVCTDGCCLKSVNQSHAPNQSVQLASARTRNRELSRTVHLHRAAAAQDRFGVFPFFGSALHPYAVLAVTEAAIVAHSSEERRVGKE